MHAPDKPDDKANAVDAVADETASEGPFVDDSAVCALTDSVEIVVDRIVKNAVPIEAMLEAVVLEAVPEYSVADGAFSEDTASEDPTTNSILEIETTAGYLISCDL